MSFVGAISAAQMSVTSSTDTYGLTDIDARRRRLQITLRALCDAASITERTWWRLIGGYCVPQLRTVIKLSKALDRLAAGERPETPPALVAAFWRAAVLVFCHETGADPVIALAVDDGSSRPMDPAWLKASRARGLAFYLTHVELQVPYTALAAACQTSKQRVHKAARTVEDRRDDPSIDALLTRAAAAVTGKNP